MSEVVDVIYIISALVRDGDDVVVDELGFYRIGTWLRVRWPRKTLRA